MELHDILQPCLRVGSGETSSVYRNGKGLVVKDMTGGNPEYIIREGDLQQAVAKMTQLVPKVRGVLGGRFLLMDDVGDSEKITDLVVAKRGAQTVLVALKQAGIRHNDLSPPNLIIKSNTPHVVDFGWARWSYEDAFEGWPSDDVAILGALDHMVKNPNKKWDWSAL